MLNFTTFIWLEECIQITPFDKLSLVMAFPYLENDAYRVNVSSGHKTGSQNMTPNSTG